MTKKTNRLKPKGTYLTEKQSELIRIKILQNKLSARRLAQLIPMGVSTFCNKLNGREEFSQTQIARLCELLGIPFSEIPKYFFDDKLSDATKAL